MAPKKLISKCPPLMMAKEVELEKIEEPGIIVIVSFPALIKSGSAFPTSG